MNLTPCPTLLAIDPGTSKSGWVSISGGQIVDAGVSDNTDLLLKIQTMAPQCIAIEWIQSMGMKVGQEVFETCLWVGRFIQIAPKSAQIIRVPRTQVKLHHCNSARAKDPNVCAAVREKYGEKGTKASPGYFYQVSSHAWQAFAVGAYVMEGAQGDKCILEHGGSI